MYVELGKFNKSSTGIYLSIYVDSSRNPPLWERKA